MRRLTDSDLEQMSVWLTQGIAKREIARRLNTDPKCVRYHESKLKPMRPILDGEVSIPLETTEEQPIEVIIKHLDDQHDRKQEYADDTLLTPVHFHDDAPIALSIIGDTHVDDPGSNRKLLTEHLELINDTPGMYEIGRAHV